MFHLNLIHFTKAPYIPITPVTLQLDLDKSTNTYYTPLKLDGCLVHQNTISWGGGGRELHKATANLTGTCSPAQSK